MIRMFVRHPVEDFAQWKKVYDDVDDMRKEMGVRDHAVFQAANDPEDVTAWHDFDDMNSARSFAESDNLRQAMDEAGVAGEPTIWFTKPV